MAKLTDAKIRGAKPTGKLQKLGDGLGLFLHVEKNGSKLWRFYFRLGGKQKTISLGRYPAVSLKEARKKREEAREIVESGRDPSKVWQENDAADAAPAPPTWRDVAEELRALKEREGRAEKTLAKLDSHLKITFDAFGDEPISNITAPQVLAMLRGIEAKGNLHTAVGVRALCGRVFRLGVATGRCERDVAADLIGAIASPKERHYPAFFEPHRVGGLVRAIRAYEGEPSTRTALLILLYTFLRPGEVRNLEWRDVKWSEGRIAIPAERMKLPRPHYVPMSAQVVDVLERIGDFTGGDIMVMPGLRKNRPLSDATLNTALVTMGYPKTVIVPHGFRRIASTLLNEDGWNRDWIERQMAHVEGNKVRGAYNAAEYLEDRTRMMQAWADKLDGLASAPAF